MTLDSPLSELTDEALITLKNNKLDAIKRRNKSIHQLRQSNRLENQEDFKIVKAVSDELDRRNIK